MQLVNHRPIVVVVVVVAAAAAAAAADTEPVVPVAPIPTFYDDLSDAWSQEDDEISDQYLHLKLSLKVAMFLSRYY